MLTIVFVQRKSLKFLFLGKYRMGGSGNMFLNSFPYCFFHIWYGTIVSQKLLEFYTLGSIGLSCVSRSSLFPPNVVDILTYI